MRVYTSVTLMYEDGVLWVCGHGCKDEPCISIRGHFYFLLKLLFIAKVVLFISKNIYSNLLLILWWEVMCCV